MFFICASALAAININTANQQQLGVAEWHWPGKSQSHY
jgi:hypothetical protein